MPLMAHFKNKQSGEKKPIIRIIFMAGPQTGRFDQKRNNHDEMLKIRLEKLMNIFEKKNFRVLSSHRKENWGKAIPPPEDIVSRDLKWIKKSDLLVAYIDDVFSAGTLIEIGWASVSHKDVLILIKDTVLITPMILGLNRITNTTLIKFHDESDVFLKVEKYVSELELNKALAD